MGNPRQLKLFYVHPDDINKNELFLIGSEAHHALDVMRLKVGSTCEVFDGRGMSYTVKLSARCGRGRVKAVIIRSRKEASLPAFSITLAQAVPRKGKFDFIIEKATELGVRTIIPMLTVRTVGKVPREKKEKAIKRWQNIIIQAAKQSRQFVLPDVKLPKPFNEVMDNCLNYDFTLIPSPREIISRKEILSRIDKTYRRKKRVSIALVIGPEGGFTPEELSYAKKNNAISFSLGKNILKTDTAVIASVGMLQSLL